ncbi:protein PsiE [Providencia alcalifaciens]|nr:protein PsiE [Providencia alcalifaciens]
MSGLSQSKRISEILQWISSTALLLLAIILISFLVKKTIVFAKLLFTTVDSVSIFLLMDGLIIYFLYFEFIALIIKYFQSNYHFPLQCFIYIAVTAIIRLIVIDHKSPELLIALYVANSGALKPGE